MDNSRNSTGTKRVDSITTSRGDNKATSRGDDVGKRVDNTSTVVDHTANEEKPVEKSIGDRSYYSKLVGRKIRAYREEHDLLQHQLGRMLFLSDASVSKYENGERNVSLDTAVSFARVMGVSLDDLLELSTVSSTASSSSSYGSPSSSPSGSSSSSPSELGGDLDKHKKQFLEAVWKLAEELLINTVK